MMSDAVAMRKLVILGIVSLAFLVGCGGGTSQSYNNQPPPPSGSNPTPTITTISPNSAVAGGAAFTLTINGTNFVAASMVNFGGTARTTTYVSATQLTAAIPAAAIVSAGTAAVKFSRIVFMSMALRVRRDPDPIPRGNGSRRLQGKKENNCTGGWL